MQSLLAVCRVRGLRPDDGAVGVTAIDKRPISGPVHIRALGLHADVQADRAHHGGEEKAVYAYAQDDIAVWEAELGRALPPGFFGENFRTQGMSLSRAIIGERWRCGSVELEVTMPRTPCASFARWMGEPDWVRRFSERNLTGAYLRVVTPGEVRAGDEIVTVFTPGHGVSIGELFARPGLEQAEAILASESAREVVLARQVREVALRVLQRQARLQNRPGE